MYLYYYDCENRLTEVNEVNDAVVAVYKYNYLGRRVLKTVSGATTKYCYDGDQVIAEYDGSDNLLRKFIYGTGIDEPICMIDVTDSNAVYYYHFDGLGSVVALSDVNSVIVESYSYDVFGQPSAASSYDNPYFFTGRRYDSETGLYYYRARYYDYYAGRFIQPDPLRYHDGLNLYTYCGNNPLRWADPYGLKAGDKYETADEAAMAAMADIYGRSMNESLEYAGWVYKRWRGGYSYTTARKGTPYTSNPGKRKVFRLERGIYHSHPKAPLAIDPESFSIRDMYVAHSLSVDVYLITPRGYQKKYDPEIGKEDILKRPKGKKKCKK